MLLYYYAASSRINNGYVQSICESVGIRFVGPEAYALTLVDEHRVQEPELANAGLDLLQLLRGVFARIALVRPQESDGALLELPGAQLDGFVPDCLV